MTKIYGASDDLIEIGGDWQDEITFVSGDEDWAVLALSDGTLLRVQYDGCWRIMPLVKGSVSFTRVDAEAEDKTGSRPTGEPWYSDVLTFDGDIKWAAHASGEAFAMSKALRSSKRR